MTLEIVEGAIKSRRDMTIVARSSNAELRTAIRTHQANVVILGERAVSENLHAQLVGVYPELKVVAITASGDDAHLYSLSTLHIADPSAMSVLDALRDILGKA